MMGRKQKEQIAQYDDPTIFANKLNKFYARFDVTDFRNECNEVCQNLVHAPVNVIEDDVVKVLSRVNPHKATGPDGLKGKVLRECAYQLGPMFTRLFQLLLDIHFIPRIWKTSTIIPVPKKPGAKILNDFRPVALTSVICKCMERIVCNKLTASLADRMDPLQFAYKAKRGVEDATLTLLDLILSHMDSSGNFVRILFMDFSSAFNTIQPHILLKRLLDLHTNTTLVFWIKAFLCDRPQRVSVQNHLSNELVLNTGAPQGCVLSPVLFSVYTDELRCNNAILTLIKFADDMALVARLKDEHSLSKYFLFVDSLQSWFDSSFLELNVGKTKEICITGGRKQDPSTRPIIINREHVEMVSVFKYLGTILDSNLRFTDNTNFIFKKAQQRLFLLRKLKSFNVSKNILASVYRSLVESVLTFNIISYHGMGIFQ